ncbi:hypothetical protein E6H23_01990 [Candidatus Bathyarchaeota archaeon]|nr:MAG: hypothetical protein E6H23_01990 [Candidatus Bathyarchaeota archaeon]
MISSSPGASYPDMPQRRSDTGIIIVVVVAVVVAAIIGGILILGFVALNSQSSSSSTHIFPVQHTGNIVNGLITVSSGGYNYYPFTLPSGATSIAVSGSFTASGGSGNDIQVLILDQTNFVNWQNGHQASAYFNSGQEIVGSITTNLPSAGTYYLVYSNTFSTFSSKNVQTTVDLSYYA